MTDFVRIPGRFPFAVLHVFKNEGLSEAIEYARRADPTITAKQAADYVRACVTANGDPNKRMI